MRRPFVAGNWKMNGRLDTVRALVGDLVAGLGDVDEGAVDVAVCPPFVYLSEVGARLADSRITLGAQNTSDEEAGAFTGETSAEMLSDFGCHYVIVGHSERRGLYRESDETVAHKYQRVLECEMTPILCVGESLAEREAGATTEVVGRQLDRVVKDCGAVAIRSCVIAYEPVWAIGTGRTATPEQAQEVHAFIRGRLNAAQDRLGEGVRILYGGSVKAANAGDLLSMPDIDGGLIGGASLEAAEFIKICEHAQ